MVRRDFRIMAWSLLLVPAVSMHRDATAVVGEDLHHPQQRLLQEQQEEEEEYVVDTGRFSTLENKKTKKVDPPPTAGNRPLCEEDIRLIGQVGGGFDRWPLRILEANGTSATLELISPWNDTDGDEEDESFLYFQYEANHNTLCDGFRSLGSGFGTQVTVECRKSSPIALVDVFAPVPGDGPEENESKEVPQCCHAGDPDAAPESDSGSPAAVQYAFLVSCEPGCGEENDERQRYLRRAF